jgi:hypothetical protein
LRGGAEIRTRLTVGRDDALREQVRNGLAGARLIRAEHVIERAVFTDDYDDVLDGRSRLQRRILGRGVLLAFRNGGPYGRRHCERNSGA